jgi:D-lactate dehydrogenase
MRLILADGAVLDTGDAASRREFAQTHGALLADIDRFARLARANKALADRIRRKFQIRNTCGYSLNALIDFEDPIDILQHLLIGSEGTLGFIAEITLRTIADPPHKATALILFPDVTTACEAATRVKDAPTAAVELMDRASLRSVQGRPGMPDYLEHLEGNVASLLIDTRAEERPRLKGQIDAITGAIAGLSTVLPVRFTDKEEEYSQLWRLRQGLYPSVGGMRATGTTVVTEDVVFPLDVLAPATTELQRLLRRHAYDQAIILGHALEGNLHVIFTEDFGAKDAVDRYARFMDEYASLIVDKYDGSLKGEHGTGRNIAPFVEREWGHEAYALMREIKSLLDPENILNPGVVLNDDRQVHLKNLKPLVAVDPIVDKCIECGACEQTCPSKALTLTPRQRIAVLRELARLQATGDDRQRERMLQRRYSYEGIETCAADGLCALTCPVDIDTGAMVKHLRGQRTGSTKRVLMEWAAKHFDLACTGVRVALAAIDRAHRMLGTSFMHGLARGAHKLSAGLMPQWNRYMPTAAPSSRWVSDSTDMQSRVVYFPSCTSRIMGPAKGDPEMDSLPVKFEALLRKAGYAVTYPDRPQRLCCGMVFESKGAPVLAERKSRELEQVLFTASRGGEDLIICDTSPCSLRLKQMIDGKLRVLDVSEFLHDHLIGRLNLQPIPGPVALHTTCSMRRMNLQEKLIGIASACAEEVIVPDNIACCGWAGDKGLTRPELTASALRHLGERLPTGCKAGYSTSRTCEIGLSLHGGRYYRSIVYLVDHCARPRQA